MFGLEKGFPSACLHIPPPAYPLEWCHPYPYCETKRTSCRPLPTCARPGSSELERGDHPATRLWLEIVTNLLKLRSPCLLISKMEMGGGCTVLGCGKGGGKSEERTSLSLPTFLKIWSEIPRVLRFIEGGPNDLSQSWCLRTAIRQES